MYNTDKYLKECLDSVINQTYKNLEVVLVNDGSTDKNSLNIAKKYVEKDSRFILFDKENGGAATCRNVGINYFNKIYETEEICNDNLRELKITNNNSYNINRIYMNKNCTNCKNIDFIMFLDSDDYWDLDCVEKSVNNIGNCYILWFDKKIFLNDINKNEIPKKFKFRIEESSKSKFDLFKLKKIKKF